jgi:ribosomal protein S18 acetylase RimI-like enzyme
VPVALIGRLGVDARAQGLRLGERLLTDALGRVVLASQQIACLGVIVDSKNPGALRFYAKYGFAPLGFQDEFPERMIVPMVTFLQAHGEEGP